jgi:hypothetical protein
MSEYQYYEFQSIDRPLTVQEQAEIQELSSRGKVTSTQAIFLYSYSDFRNKPEHVLTKYFDAMFYIANWGTWRLMFRFPTAIIDPKCFQSYVLPDVITMTKTSQYVVLDIEIHEEDGINGWVEGEGWLSQLLPLRDELLAGDGRLLYLVWLRVAAALAGDSLDEDPIEPPIPPNLSQLSPALQAFVELVELNSDLVAAAAQASPDHQDPEDRPLEDWLPALTAAERQKFLLKLVRRELHVDQQLINRLQELAGADRSTPQSTPGHRKLSEIEAIASNEKKMRQQQEKNAAKKTRIKELKALAPRVEETWQQVVKLLEVKQALPYDQATALLKDLRDVAEHQGRLPEFGQRFEKLKSDYQTRPALMKRFKSILSHS